MDDGLPVLYRDVSFAVVVNGVRGSLSLSVGNSLLTIDCVRITHSKMVG